MKANDIHSEPTAKFQNKLNVQTFALDNKTFLLDNEMHLKILYLKILNLGSDETLTHTLNRRPNLIQHLTELVTVDESLAKHSILGALLPPEFIIKQLTRGLSFIMNSALQNAIISIEDDIRDTSDFLANAMTDVKKSTNHC